MLGRSSHADSQAGLNAAESRLHLASFHSKITNTAKKRDQSWLMSGLEVLETVVSERLAENLLLRQLSKDVTIRLSQALQVANGDARLHTNLLAISNQAGFAFAATNTGFQVIELSMLRAFYRAAKRNTSPDFNQATAIVDTVKQPNIGSLGTFLRVGHQHSVVLTGFQNGVLAAWSIKALVEASNTTPILTLQPPSPGLSLIDLVPNPSDRPELAVALYRQPGSSVLDSGTPILVNLSSGSFAAQLEATGSRATSVCWSVESENVFVGLDNGEIVQWTFEGKVTDCIPRPTSLDASYCVCDLRWLETLVFVATYKRPSDDDELQHDYEVFAIVRDPKLSRFTFAKMPRDPAPPYGDTSRKGTRYGAWLKNWEPSKHLLFITSGPSTDVGLIACSSREYGPGAWATMELEETSKPVLPFSSVDESSDAAPVALEFDLTSTEDVEDPNAVARGDGKLTLPAVPILYVYTSDGVLLAYNVINTEGGPYDSMVTPVPKVESVSVLSSLESKASSLARHSGSQLLADAPSPESLQSNAAGQTCMQIKFLEIYMDLTEELRSLKETTIERANLLQQMKSANLTIQSSNMLTDASLWTLGDLPKMQASIQSLAHHFDLAQANLSALHNPTTKIQSSQLLTQTKLNEVARFLRARTDPGVARNIHARQLGPLQAESQRNLRIAVQIVRRQILELEAHLAELKLDVQDARAGRSRMRAPMLDSISRSCRNTKAKTWEIARNLDAQALELRLFQSPRITHSSAGT